MQSVSDVWSMILTRLREELSETTIKTWFDEDRGGGLEGDTMILYCPNAFKRRQTSRTGSWGTSRRG